MQRECDGDGNSRRPRLSLREFRGSRILNAGLAARSEALPEPATLKPANWPFPRGSSSARRTGQRKTPTLMREPLGARVVVAVVALFSATSALGDPLLLSFVPSSQSVVLGQPASVELVLSGFPAVNRPTVAGFDLEIAFDPSLLSVTDVSYDTYLGDPDPSASEALVSTTFPSPGYVDIAEVSFHGLPYLSTVQDGVDPLPLASISFDTLAAGTANLGMSWSYPPFAVTDENGSPLNVTGIAGSIMVTSGGGPGPGPTPVPEPGAVLLLATFFAILAATRYQSRRRPL